MAKQRQIRVEQKSALAAIQQLESRSDEELEREQKYRAAAMAILGARAAERYDSAGARSSAVAAKRPRGRKRAPAGDARMCGRYTLATPDPSALRVRFAVGERVEIRRRYNVAPGDDVLTVTTDRDGAPRGELLRW